MYTDAGQSADVSPVRFDKLCATGGREFRVRWPKRARCELKGAAEKSAVHGMFQPEESCDVYPMLVVTNGAAFFVTLGRCTTKDIKPKE